MNQDRPRIEVLLDRIADPALRDQLTAEVEALNSGRKFGLVFEGHAPEAVRIPNAKVRRGSTVQYRDGDDQRVWKVVRAKAGEVTLVHQDGERRENVLVTDLVVARELGDPVYPGFIPTGTIEQGGDKPHHLVIQGENYHALQTLLYTHKEAVDLIYIDPPYNTGAGDWIYNDRYVGDADAYRHSKWLSFMEKRLELARKLLKPTGAIMVSINDIEQHRLRMLLDQVMGANSFVANMVWQKGAGAQQGDVLRLHEYILVYKRRESPRFSIPGASDFIVDRALKVPSNKNPITSLTFPAGVRVDAPDGTAFTGTWGGRESTRLVEGEFLVENGMLKSPVTLEAAWTQANQCRDYFAGAEVRDSKGQRVVEFFFSKAGKLQYRKERGTLTPSSLVSDISQATGTEHLTNVLSSHSFPFPKPVDLIKYLCSFMPSDSVILDFFAGTGTTSEAVMSLNSADGGNRQSIVVTNNELSNADVSLLEKAGHQPGDPEWEAEGVFEKVTRPRIEAVVTGVRSDGTKLTEQSKNGVGKPIKGATALSENVSFLKLDYLQRDDVELGKAFRQVAELLWVKAGSVGPVISELGESFAFTDRYGILFDTDRGSGFEEEAARRGVHMVFVITDSTEVFGSVRRQLPEEIRAVHLYRNYLSNFEINTRKVI